MIPLKPFSVKFPPELRNSITVVAEDVGYSENQVIVESVQSVLGMIGQVDKEILPLVVVLVRAAREHRQVPPRLGKHSKAASRRKRGSRTRRSKKKIQPVS